MLNSFAGTQVNYQGLVFQILVFQISIVSRGSYQPLWSTCSGSEPFGPVEHLAIRRRWNIPINKYGDSTGEYLYSVVLTVLSLQLLSESRLRFLQLFTVISTFWFVLFKFEISISVQICVILVFMVCYHIQFDSIHLDLVCFLSDPLFSFCFGHL